MTDRLYYDQTYLREFDATVTKARREGAACLAVLDRSAFYPTSGGQPFDTGTLEYPGSSVRVLDVYIEQGEVWHKVDGPLNPGQAVRGRVDWVRRFDHMQQHGGEHMLAGAVHTLLGGVTEGLHLGAQESTIDVELPGGRVRLSADETAALEEWVNERIQLDDAVRCYFPHPQELASLPLRKKPTVTEHVRVVAFGDYEMVACGGTHPSTAGQIGLLKILSVVPAKGKARIAFVCGMRAVRWFERCQRAVREVGALLSCPAEEAPLAVRRLMTQAVEDKKELARFRTQALFEEMQNAAGTAPALPQGGHCAMLCRPGEDMDAMTRAAGQLILRPGHVALLSDGRRLIFARSADLPYDMAALMRRVAKGGGKGDFATGAGEEGALAAARAQLEREQI